MVIGSVLAQCSKGIWLMGFIKSKIETDSSVKVANTRNFQDVVLDSGREALILFYAPWCTHCHKVTSVWDELGDELKDEKVDIVKIDATVNEWPRSRFYVHSYPTIYWKFADTSKEPIKYYGGRGLYDFIKYVSQNASSELSGWDRKGKRK